MIQNQKPNEKIFGEISRNPAGRSGVYTAEMRMLYGEIREEVYHFDCTRGIVLIAG